MRILLIEDEPELAAALTQALKRYDMVADHVPTLGEGQAAAMGDVHDAIVLDRSLPDGDGVALIPRLRAMGLRTPVIVLTARADLSDRVVGLDAGADDYLVKPFAIEELLARLRAVLRRPARMASDTIRIGLLAFDLVARLAEVDGRALELPRRELLLLEALLRRRGRTVMRNVIEEAVYGFDDDIQSNTLDSHVSRLRRKLAEAGAGVEIHGIRGIGYLLREAA
ncbi:MULTISPECIES: response regulator transcription factor [unclassified Lysobacter]|uniref:response regulator transcription factor n=1 Tax=unclassified Lysobacter TaxID=2635362 RepID=UPI001BEAD5C5|nr:MULTISPECIES: response regulator transcription factor [unclassified Lysobacter]MBT2744862.1 response regulator transcription factor [Lysobacter sp. ISL-42]MBT2752145.1 response regulator transcription factor [Lysobacter sp. ISL-50]MBT2778642.1 response regulator transcription factor [Lysobacter sp. ISL-54]MBT2780427.1 response regulator transcription factor [Lysobacter sp. ISL-52]